MATLLKRRMSFFGFIAAAFISACTIAQDIDDDDDGDGGAGASAPSGCVVNAECSGDTPRCERQTGECLPLERGHQIGWGDGSPATVALIAVYQPSAPLEVTDLGFHPSRPNELWVVQREFQSSEPCNQSFATEQGCTQLEGSVAVIQNPGAPDVSWQIYKDPNAWHFMRLPTSIAHGEPTEVCIGKDGALCTNKNSATWFGNSDSFATCHEARSGNFDDDPLDFIGPTLWPSDVSLFATSPPEMNGSHLDMLHATPFCMGIAHESANIYWTFNGMLGSIERYDFRASHQIGGHDHSDASIYRYAQGQLRRTPGVPSHMVFNPADGLLYIADTGNGRIVKLDTSGATKASPLFPNYEMIADAHNMVGEVLSDVVPPGTLTAPSGMELYDNLLFVTDNATSRIHAFELDGSPVNTLQLDFPPGALAGMAFGPEGRLFVADKSTGMIYRIDPGI